MTDIEYKAAKYSFTRIPETCPLVDAKLYDLLLAHQITETGQKAIRDLIDFAKSKNEELRELTFDLGKRLIDHGVELK